MNRVKLPSEYNYAEAYLTLKCNFNCEYCINRASGKVCRSRMGLGVSEWAEGLNRIDFGDLPLTIGGGEPTLHPEFYDILDAIKPEIKIDLLTNLSVDVDEFAARTKPERFTQSDHPAHRAIRVSYHVGQTDVVSVVSKIAYLQAAGFSIGLFGIGHPHNYTANMIMADRARKAGIYFFVKEYLGEYRGRIYGRYKYPRAIDGRTGGVNCRIRDFLIDPGGYVFRCHMGLYFNYSDYILGNLLDRDLGSNIEYMYRPCDNYGTCNLCDIKMKTDRNLSDGFCSADIIGIES